jgi:hypothetical protein
VEAVLLAGPDPPVDPPPDPAFDPPADPPFDPPLDPAFDPPSGPPESALVELVELLDRVELVALAGAEPLPGDDGWAARAGEIATRSTTPAANGNRNRRCMAASLHLDNIR